jgi:isoaspartyl peptidase/L-asparaginase-like protein (Ntn-hydrolase superfamily)
MKPSIVTHCGSGSDIKMRDVAEESAAIGMNVLRRGGSALKAVEEAIVVLEDDPRTNTGLGARRRVDGTVQMDAAIMDSNLRIGSVAAIMNVRNPIRVARLVMDSPHVLLVGEGAVLFARQHGVPFFDPSNKESEEKWRDALAKIESSDMPEWAAKWRGFRFKDTVGAVAQDENGSFAAGSSTGGHPYMLPGRVGDSPIVGAGLYAGPRGAVTATGVGEEIIRVVLSKTVYDHIGLKHTAMDSCISGIKPFPDTVPVGVIAVDRKGWGECCNRDMAWAALPCR